METAQSPSETEFAIADVRRRQIHVVVRDIGDWLLAIVSSVEIGAVNRGDLDALQRELRKIERQLEQLSSEMILVR
jgi:hypothetical protein